jgi:hypothetical protein
MVEVEPCNFCELLIIVYLQSEFNKIPEMQGVRWKVKYSRGINLRGDSTFRCVEKFQEIDS